MKDGVSATSVSTRGAQTLDSRSWVAAAAIMPRCPLVSHGGDSEDIPNLHLVRAPHSNLSKRLTKPAAPVSGIARLRRGLVQSPSNSL